MSAADLELRRTLTDVLDDEMRVLGGNSMDTGHEGFPQLTRSQFNSFYKSSAFGGIMQQFQTQAQHSQQQQHNQNNSAQSSPSMQSLDMHSSDDDMGNGMFNKYADPNLTTLDKKSSSNGAGTGAPIVKQVNLNLTPVQPTISLNTITPNPFVVSSPVSTRFNQPGNGTNGNNYCSQAIGTNNASRLGGSIPQFNLQTRINNERENGLEEDDYYNDVYADFNNMYEEDEKLSAQNPLWDEKNTAGYYWTNDQDTLSRFDQEFNFDDDLSDDDDENVFANEEEEVPLEESQLKEESDVEEMAWKSNDEPLFMDTRKLTEIHPIVLSEHDVDVPLLEPVNKEETAYQEFKDEADNEENASDIFSEDDEDPLYEPALGNLGRKPSMVITKPDTTLQRQLLMPKSSSKRPTESKKEVKTASSASRTLTRTRGRHQRVKSLDLDESCSEHDHTHLHSHSHTDCHSHSHSHTHAHCHIEGMDHSHTSNGEHVCMYVNPVTKEPCMKKFSRPYDLIRHQKTIHATKKKIFRCLLCIQELGEEGYQRTFSRTDALSRHIKVKHGLQGAEAQRILQYAKDNVEYQTS